MPGAGSGRLEMEWGQVFWILTESEWKFLSREETEVGLNDICSCDTESFFPSISVFFISNRDKCM